MLFFKCMKNEQGIVYENSLAKITKLNTNYNTYRYKIKPRKQKAIQQYQQLNKQETITANH